MKRVACYVRVSSAEQKRRGLSVDNQISALQEYCSTNGYIMAGLYNDAGISARKSYKKRPALLQLVDDCKAGKIDLIIFTKLDRWFRSVGDYYEVQKELDSAKVPWRAIWEDYETETSAGIFKVNIMLSVAQSEADRTSERIRDIIEYKRERGDYVGGIPYGYMRKDGKLYKNPEQAPLVEFIFESFIANHSARLSYRMAVDKGYPYTFRCFEKIFDTPAYSGGNGQYSCEPYITQEQAAAVALARSQTERHPKFKKHDYIFSGLCRCGFCGTRMHGQSNVVSDRRYYRYRCGSVYDFNGHKPPFYYSEKLLEEYMLEKLDVLIQDHNAKVSAGASVDEANAARSALKSLEAQRERIGIRYEMGEIDTDEYKNKIAQIKKEMSSIVIPQNNAPVELPPDWRDAYAELDRAHKANFWRGIIAYIELYPHKTNEIAMPPRVYFK